MGTRLHHSNPNSNGPILHIGAIVISNYRQTLGGVDLPVLLPIGNCSGSESSLQSCPMAASSNETFVCSSSVNVGIVCQGMSL